MSMEHHHIVVPASRGDPRLQVCAPHGCPWLRKWPRELAQQTHVAFHQSARPPQCCVWRRVDAAPKPLRRPIFMGKTDPEAAPHKQQSMVLVPMATSGASSCFLSSPGFFFPRTSCLPPAAAWQASGRGA